MRIFKYQYALLYISGNIKNHTRLTELLSLYLLIVIISLTTSFAETCYSSALDINPVCHGGLVQSTLGSSCRTIVCTNNSDRIKVLACDKPDKGNKNFFEMYNQEVSGNTKFNICLLETCISDNGYTKSTDFPICIQDDDLQNKTNSTDETEKSCIDAIGDSSASCSGGEIISDITNGVCRIIVCSSSNNNLKIMACNKPDGKNPPSYFEMYKQSVSENIEICLGSTCISRNGFARSSNYSKCEDSTTGPICGNSIKEDEEECDDGNSINGDGCDNFCKNEIIDDSNQTIPECYDNLYDLPVNCSSQIIFDIISGGCRITQCSGKNGSITVKACNKPGENNRKYFEMYRTEKSGIIPTLCIGNQCIWEHGFLRSTAYPICLEINTDPKESHTTIIEGPLLDFSLFNAPGIPFLADQDVKRNAPTFHIAEPYMFSFDDYSVGNEVIRAETEYNFENPIDVDAVVQFVWKNRDTGISGSPAGLIIPAGTIGTYPIFATIGKKPFGAGELDRAGNYSISFNLHKNNSVEKSIFNFSITGTNPEPCDECIESLPTIGAELFTESTNSVSTPDSLILFSETFYKPWPLGWETSGDGNGLMDRYAIDGYQKLRFEGEVGQVGKVSMKQIINVSISDDTKLLFDVFIAAEDLGECSDCYPAGVLLEVETPTNAQLIHIKYTSKERVGQNKKIEKNTWHNGETVRIRDIVPNATRVTKIIIESSGYIVESHFDNIFIVEDTFQRANEATARVVLSNKTQDHNKIFECEVEGLEPEGYIWWFEERQRTEIRNATRILDGVPHKKNDMMHAYIKDGNFTTMCVAFNETHKISSSLIVENVMDLRGVKVGDQPWEDTDWTWTFFEQEYLGEGRFNLTCDSVGFESVDILWVFDLPGFDVNDIVWNVTRFFVKEESIINVFPIPDRSFSTFCPSIVKPMYYHEYYEDIATSRSSYANPWTGSIEVPSFNVSNAGDVNCPIPNGYTEAYICRSTGQVCAFDSFHEIERRNTGVWDGNKSLRCNQNWWMSFVEFGQWSGQDPQALFDQYT
ncbi:MAG TPA: DUF4215 domain-containing protein [Candidatus Nanoarchaeia archaeon]|nr:DUF4215 domain-containing protein [Candidatus Nanoarchaeia archaeon]